MAYSVEARDGPQADLRQARKVRRLDVPDRDAVDLDLAEHVHAFRFLEQARPVVVGAHVVELRRALLSLAALAIAGPAAVVVVDVLHGVVVTGRIPVAQEEDRVAALEE